MEKNCCQHVDRNFWGDPLHATRMILVGLTTFNSNCGLSKRCFGIRNGL